MDFLQRWIDFHPLRLFGVVFLLLLLAHGLFARQGKNEPRWIAAMVAACAVAALAVTLWRLWPYFTSPACGWPLEPQIISVSEMVRRGAPAWPRPEVTGLCYGQVYGPATYLTYAAVFQLFGRSIEAAKAASALASLAALSFMTILVWRSRHEHRVALLALLAAVFAYFGIYVWGIRPDPWILLSLSFFLLGLILPRRILGLVLASLAGGWLLAYKPSGALYLMAPLVWAWQNKGWRWAWLCGALMIPAALWPFLLPQFSMHDYLLFLRGAGNLPFLANTLSGPAQTIILLVLLVTVGQAAKRKEWWVTIAFLAGLAGTLMTSGRLLAVNHHFIPYFLVGLFLVCLANKGGSTLLLTGRNHAFEGEGQLYLSSTLVPAALALTLAMPAWLASYNQNMRGEYEAEARLSRSILSDLDQIIASHPNQTIIMAMGAGYADAPRSLTPYRSHLILKNQPYFLDVETAMEIELQGINPNQTIKMILEKNKEAVWLTPKGQAPFAALSSYKRRPIIDPAMPLSVVKANSSFESACFDMLHISN